MIDAADQRDAATSGLSVFGVWRRDGAGLQLDQLGLRESTGAENRDSRNGSSSHRDLVAGVESRAALAILVDLVGQHGAFDDAEAEVKEEVGDSGEETDAGDALVFCFGKKSAQQLSSGTLSLGLGLDDD